MEAIHGITIEQYAELCARMKDVMADENACVAIAQDNGVVGAEWLLAHKGWQAKMQEMSDMGRTATAFVPLWQSALERINGPAVQPCTFEEFARVQAAMSYDLNPDRDAVLSGCGITREKWQEWNGYWAPRLAEDMSLQGKLAQIMQQPR